MQTVPAWLLLQCLNHSFFFNDPPTTEIDTLSLHDALPISSGGWRSVRAASESRARRARRNASTGTEDRKSTRLNSSHRCISYAVFCLKKKKHQSYARPRPLLQRYHPPLPPPTRRPPCPHCR